MRNAPFTSMGRPLLSRTGEHAVRAALFLGRRDGPTLVRASEVARVLGTPPNYTGKVLRQLARHGVLSSVRGPHGGFRLRLLPSEITLARLVGAFDETMGPPAMCLLGDRPCQASHPCGAHRRWQEVQDRAHQVLVETTLEDLLGNDPMAPPPPPHDSDPSQHGGYHA